MVKVNVWEENGAWFFALWVDGEYDCNGDVPGDVDDAVAWAQSQWPDADVSEIDATA